MLLLLSLHYHIALLGLLQQVPLLVGYMALLKLKLIARFLQNVLRVDSGSSLFCLFLNKILYVAVASYVDLLVWTDLLEEIL